jgi:UTRA domain
VTFTKQELTSRPLLELLERAGVKVEHARQRISAGLATPDVANALKVRIGSPLIELVRVVCDQSGGRSSIFTRSTGPTVTPSKWILCVPARPDESRVAGRAQQCREKERPRWRRVRRGKSSISGARRRKSK